MSKINEYIDTLDLHVDGTYRGNCPKCGGRNTFTVTNDKGNVLYNCYKNSCRIAGAHHKNLDAFTIKTILAHGGTENASESYTEALQETFDLPPYLSTTIPLTEKVKDFLDKWSIYPEHVMYDVRQDRVVFPVVHNSMTVDAVGRSLTGRQPKWLRYASSPVPYMWGHGDVMVVVEDAISAYKVGEMFGECVGVALLGTQLTPFHKWFFNTYYRYNTFIVALDPDARDKSIKIARELGGRALNLRDDLKYARHKDIMNLREMLNG